jgi:hypothetical protein
MKPGTIIYGAWKNPRRTYFPEVVGGIAPALQETERMEEKMERKKISKSAWSGAVAAAAFLMAPQAHATAWCPTRSDNVIRCSSCTRELTCDVNGFDIYITGNLVTLDGKSHWINYAPGEALQVTGVGNYIKYVYIQSPGQTGISSTAPYDGSSYTVLDNVYVTGAGQNGIVNYGPSPVTINNSTVSYSRYAGVVGTVWPAPGVPTNHNTDIRYSTLNHNSWDGYYGQVKNSWLINSTFAYNGSNGAWTSNNSGAQIVGNAFYGNGTNAAYEGQRFGLEMNNISGVLRNNYGRSNYSYDCQEDSWAGPVSHSGNDWGSAVGPDCRP